jgi:hypothetical protein
MARRLAPEGPRLIRLASLLVLLYAPLVAAERLCPYPVDPAQGLGSRNLVRRFLANQLRIAHSADVMGGSMIAVGPYGCATLEASSNGVEAPASQAS